jgi:hypothetical protein
MSFQQPVTSTQRGTRNPATKLIQPSLSFSCGMSGSVAPDRNVVVSQWTQCQPGGTADIKLHVTALAGTVQGTLDVTVETASNPFDAVTNPRGNPSEAPRPLLQQFDSVAGTIMPAGPLDLFLTAPTDGWIRVIVTPGQSPGQLANYTISGNLYHAGTRNPV